MPEIAKVSGHEEASSKTEEPGIGAKKIANLWQRTLQIRLRTPQPSCGPSPDPEKASEELEGSNDPQPEDAEEKSTDTFAGNVADGPRGCRDRGRTTIETREKTAPIMRTRRVSSPVGMAWMKSMS